jgi:hypothetical protein
MSEYKPDGLMRDLFLRANGEERALALTAVWEIELACEEAEARNMPSGLKKQLRSNLRKAERKIEERKRSNGYW